MKKAKYFFTAACLLAAFALWTAIVRLVHVQPIGPQGSAVGLAGINRAIHNLTGVHMPLYVVTDWLSLIPLGFVTGFAGLGLLQWIRRKNLLKVDYSLLVLGGFYLAVLSLYVFFDLFAVNYRPVLIEGILETSYPSSTTMLVLCVMPTTVMQLNTRIANTRIRRCAAFAITTFTVFMVAGRLMSGVHWLSDIIGGILLSAGLVTMYRAVSGMR